MERSTTLLIGGTAAYHLDLVDRVHVEQESMIDTPYGSAGPILFFTYAKQSCAFLSRHGGQGQLGVTPPFINYQANLWVAKAIHARRIVSWNSVGSLIRAFPPGSLAAVSDIIDWTKGRRSTFGHHLPDRCRAGPPYFDQQLRQRLVEAGRLCSLPVAPGAVYGATAGARLETRAEIRLLGQAGAELVGMTLAPEVFLARELDLPYGSLCWVANYAAGVPYDGPEQRLFGPEVGRLMLGIILKLLDEEEGAGER